MRRTHSGRQLTQRRGRRYALRMGFSHSQPTLLHYPVPLDLPQDEEITERSTLAMLAARPRLATSRQK